MKPNARSERSPYMLIIHHQTEKAILVSVSGDRDLGFWLPLSQCEVDQYDDSGTSRVWIPEWLATKHEVALSKRRPTPEIVEPDPDDELPF